MIPLPDSLLQCLHASASPVILLEGTRELPGPEYAVLERLETQLLPAFPHATFRSENAVGSDTVFAGAISRLDLARVQLVSPHAGMGRARRPVGATVVSLDALLEDDLYSLAAHLRQIGRDPGRLADYYLSGPEARKTRAGNQSVCLLRDALMVTGSPSAGLAPASLGIFRTHSYKPESGGTGFTIEVGGRTGIPAISTVRRFLS